MLTYNTNGIPVTKCPPNTASGATTNRATLRQLAAERRRIKKGQTDAT